MLNLDGELGGNGLVPGDLRSLGNRQFREIRPVLFPSRLLLRHHEHAKCLSALVVMSQ